MRFHYLLLSMALVAPAALAQTHSLRGSDTLAGVMTDAIVAAGLDGRVAYLGGGSTLGESSLVGREQGISPMSRLFKQAALDAASATGISPVAHVIGLDGVGVFINAGNGTAKLSLGQLKAIFTCALTQWQDIPGSGLAGPIRVVRRNDSSGTTDTFKSLVGISQFGACAMPLAETADIAEVTASDATAIGYAGMTARRDGNRAAAVASSDAALGVLPTVATIRSKAYPLARELYVYEATGSHRPNELEATLLGYLLDRSFMDPILQDNDFYTVD